MVRRSAQLPGALETRAGNGGAGVGRGYGRCGVQSARPCCGVCGDITALGRGEGVESAVSRRVRQCEPVLR